MTYPFSLAALLLLIGTSIPSITFALSHPSPLPNLPATLLLSSFSTTPTLGDSLSVELKLSSPSPLTSLKSTLLYDSSKLYLSSIETQNSDFPYWWERSSSIESPTAKIMLQASVPVPGIITPAALVATLHFRAIGTGSTTLIHDPNSLVLNSTDQNILNLSESKGTSLTILPSSSFSRDLQRGDQGPDVKSLQQFLNSSGFMLTTQPTTPGSPGNETDYFGPLTNAALIRFQEAYPSEILAPFGLTQGTGYFGSMTRAKVRELFKF